MEKISKILPEPEVNTLGSIGALEFMSKDKYHVLNEASTDYMIRLLIFKINELITEVNMYKTIIHNSMKRADESNRIFK